MGTDDVNRRAFLAAVAAAAVSACAGPADAKPPATVPAAGRSFDPDGDLSVLKSLAAETPPDGTHCVILQHVLPTTVAYVEQVHRVYPVDLVIAICYSADPATVAALRAKGFDVYVPRDIDFMLNDLWRVVADHVAAVTHPVMIQEVGGYFAEWTHELGKLANFRGVVEDTKNGLWRYQAAARAKPLGVPVLSMADTALKRVEDSLIGDANVYSLEKVLRTQMASMVDGLRCGVVGWGNIGKSAATALRGRNAVVAIYDIDPVVTMLAYGRGFFPMPLAQLLRESDVVMGCSGRRSIRVADLPDFKDGLVLCSASSKDVEIDLVGLAQLCDVTDVTPAHPGACPVTRFVVRATGKAFYVLDRGTPIDFLDTPLQGSILDCTCSELFVCMRELAAGKRPAGLVELASDLQDMVARRWLQLHSDVFAAAGAGRDKIFDYPASLDWA